MTANTAPDTVGRLNAMSAAEFTALLGGIFERSPWVAERTHGRRPFKDVGELHAAMTGAVESAARDEQLALLRAHPELAGREARAGSMTESSVDEQSSAGLDALSADELSRMARLNAVYRKKHGFPFIIAVRNHDKRSIFAELERRLDNDGDAELRNNLEEIYAITRMRLDALLG